jgi:hypothetical protein
MVYEEVISLRQQVYTETVVYQLSTWQLMGRKCFRILTHPAVHQNCTSNLDSPFTQQSGIKATYEASPYL